MTRTNREIGTELAKQYAADERANQRSEFRGTRYEIAVTHTDGRRFLVCYSVRTSRSTLHHIIRDNAADIIATLGKGHHRFVPGFVGRFPTERAGEWSVGFTGRTRRDIETTGDEAAEIGGAK